MLLKKIVDSLFQHISLSVRVHLRHEITRSMDLAYIYFSKKPH
jgi:hypothetical protein